MKQLSSSVVLVGCTDELQNFESWTPVPLTMTLKQGTTVCSPFMFVQFADS